MKKYHVRNSIEGGKRTIYGYDLQDVRAWALVLGGAGAFGALLYILAEPAAGLVNDAMPLSGSVRGRGTNYPGLADENGLEHQLKWLGAIIPLSFLLAMVGPSIAKKGSRLLRGYRVNARHVPYLVPILTGLGYLYLAYPPGAYASNARMHWVDQFYGRSDHFLYSLVKIPPRVFYEHPYIYVGLIGAANSLLVVLILKRIGAPIYLQGLGGISFAISSNLLTFANMAEDVQINIFAMLLTLLFIVARRWILVGVGLFLLFLGRPPLVLLAVSLGVVGVVMMVVRRRRGVSEELTDSMRNIAVALAIAGILFVLWFGFLSAADSNWMTPPEGPLPSTVSGNPVKSVDGFELHRGSGAYLLHALWVFPVPVVVGAIATIGRITRLSKRTIFNLSVVGTFLVLSMLFLELVPTMYYNVRYLTYYYVPLWLICIIGVNGILHPWAERQTNLIRRAVGAGLIVTLCLAPLAPHSPAFARKEKLKDRPITELHEVQDQLQELGEGSELVTTFGQHTWVNYLSYVFKRPFGNWTVVEDVGASERVEEPTVFVVRREEVGDLVSDGGSYFLSYIGSGVAVVWSPKPRATE